mmetsp:Transcript_103157/g.292242  ORF Transcript_103157/g.292242 Transcript_103157/m.292242 type:complete len:231 (+) Transcript_103157:174-866(+)
MLSAQRCAICCSHAVRSRPAKSCGASVMAPSRRFHTSATCEETWLRSSARTRIALAVVTLSSLPEIGTGTSGGSSRAGASSPGDRSSWPGSLIGGTASDAFGPTWRSATCSRRATSSERAATSRLTYSHWRQSTARASARSSSACCSPLKKTPPPPCPATCSDWPSQASLSFVRSARSIRVSARVGGTGPPCAKQPPPSSTGLKRRRKSTRDACTMNPTWQKCSSSNSSG